MSQHFNSLQFNNGKFHNSVDWKQPSGIDFIRIMKKFLFGKEQRVPKSKLPRIQADLPEFNKENINQLKVIWLGHSSLMINIEGYKILTDPVFEKKVSFFGPTRYNGEIPLDIDNLPEIDLVLLSHNHYDHLNKYSINLLKDKTNLFIVPVGVGQKLKKWGVQENKIIVLDWWNEYEISQNLRIIATPSQHFSGRGLTDRDKTLWMSFVIQSDNYDIYFGGDSGYFNGFKTIGDKYGPFDMTFLECGAYNEKWRHIHMFPEDTVQAHIDLKGKILHPIHWGTFNLSLHSWFEPMERLSKDAQFKGVETATPIVGGMTIYGSNFPNDKWWQPFMPHDNKNQININELKFNDEY